MADQRKGDEDCARVALVVSKQHVKDVKSALERAGQLDRSAKIAPEKIDPDGDADAQQRMRIPTMIPYLLTSNRKDEGSYDQETYFLINQLVEDLQIKHLHPHISLSYQTFSGSHAAPNLRNPVRKALEEALDALPPSILSNLLLTTETLVSSFPESYLVYKPMLLLSHNAFTSTPWTRLLTVHPSDSEILKPLWKHIASSVNTTHIATNSPIPPRKDENNENIIRSPVNLTPIYGTFGPRPTPQNLIDPTPQDFDAALWVTTAQNGIHQTWVPLYTMFSRGNIREKSRILHHPSVTAELDTPSAAVDLYAGIGYFAFSYKKGGASEPPFRRNGIKTVLCFELNPWSVEGLRRGAELNGWTCRIFREDDVPATNEGWELWREDIQEQGVRHDFWIFHMSNDRAVPILQDHLADLLPPIRHVNLGLLPTSRLSWSSASRLVDAERGGWIRVHENIGVGEIEERRVEVRDTFKKMMDEYDEGGEREVEVEHFERVKMFAPGVVHGVFDVRVAGKAAQHVRKREDT
jgi:tRNA wybutosine-synthesizing protein 2